MIKKRERAVFFCFPRAIYRWICAFVGILLVSAHVSSEFSPIFFVLATLMELQKVMLGSIQRNRH